MMYVLVKNVVNPSVDPNKCQSMIMLSRRTYYLCVQTEQLAYNQLASAELKLYPLLIFYELA